MGAMVLEVLLRCGELSQGDKSGGWVAYQVRGKVGLLTVTRHLEERLGTKSSSWKALELCALHCTRAWIKLAEERSPHLWLLQCSPGRGHQHPFPLVCSLILSTPARMQK